jgi:hypothetical protein
MAPVTACSRPAVLTVAGGPSAMFEGERSVPSDGELRRTADDAAPAFLAAYGAPRDPEAGN